MFSPGEQASYRPVPGLGHGFGCRQRCLRAALNGQKDGQGEVHEQKSRDKDYALP